MIKPQWIVGAFAIAFGNLTILAAGRRWDDAPLALTYLFCGLLLQISGSSIYLED